MAALLVKGVHTGGGDWGAGELGKGDGATGGARGAQSDAQTL